MKFLIIALLAFGLMFAGCAIKPTTGAAPVSAFPPGYQAARDGNVISAIYNLSSTNIIWNNATGRQYIITYLQGSDNGTHSLFSLDYCATANSTNTSQCLTNWSTVFKTYTPLTNDLMSAPVAALQGAAFRVSETPATTGFINVRYLNMTQYS